MVDRGGGQERVHRELTHAHESEDLQWTALAGCERAGDRAQQDHGKDRQAQIGHRAVGFDVRGDREGAREEPDRSATQQPSGAACRGQPGHARNASQSIRCQNPQNKGVLASLLVDESETRALHGQVEHFKEQRGFARHDDPVTGHIDIHFPHSAELAQPLSTEDAQCPQVMPLTV
jgi:hypothetical protein